MRVDCNEIMSHYKVVVDFIPMFYNLNGYNLHLVQQFILNIKFYTNI